MSRAERRALVERDAPALPVSRQCRLLSVSRASVYRRPAAISEEDCTIMALIDRQYLARPYYGSRRMAAWLAGDPGPCRQPQTGGAAPDAARSPGGDLSAAEYEQAGTGAQDLPLPARAPRSAPSHKPPCRPGRAGSRQNTRSPGCVGGGTSRSHFLLNLTLLSGVTTLLSACNTMSGMGEDVSATGRAVVQ